MPLSPMQMRLFRFRDCHLYTETLQFCLDYIEDETLQLSGAASK